uniref:hypothetical protein n=1 Tax=Flavobacterium sp. TaxID=239 RepID=UPI0040493B08
MYKGLLPDFSVPREFRLSGQQYRAHLIESADSEEKRNELFADWNESKLPIFNKALAYAELHPDSYDESDELPDDIDSDGEPVDPPRLVARKRQHETIVSKFDSFLSDLDDLMSEHNLTLLQRKRACRKYLNLHK